MEFFIPKIFRSSRPSELFDLKNEVHFCGDKQHRFAPACASELSDAAQNALRTLPSGPIDCPYKHEAGAHRGNDPEAEHDLLVPIRRSSRSGGAWVHQEDAAAEGLEEKIWIATERGPWRQYREFIRKKKIRIK